MPATTTPSPVTPAAKQSVFQRFKASVEKFLSPNPKPEAKTPISPVAVTVTSAPVFKPHPPTTPLPLAQTKELKLEAKAVEVDLDDFLNGTDKKNTTELVIPLTVVQPELVTTTSSDTTAVTSTTEKLVKETTVKNEAAVKETALQQSVDMAEIAKKKLLEDRQQLAAKTVLVTEILKEHTEAQINEANTHQAELVSAEQATSKLEVKIPPMITSSDTSSSDQRQKPSPTNKSARNDFAIGAGKGTLYGLAGISSVFAAAFVGFSIDAAIVGAPFLAGCFATLNFIIALAPIAAAVLLAVALTVGFIEMYRTDDKPKKIQDLSDQNAKNMTGNSTELATKKLNSVTVSPKPEQLSSDKALGVAASAGTASVTGMFSGSEAASDSKKDAQVENQRGCSIM